MLAKSKSAKSCLSNEFRGHFSSPHVPARFCQTRHLCGSRRHRGLGGGEAAVLSQKAKGAEGVVDREERIGKGVGRMIGGEGSSFSS